MITITVLHDPNLQVYTKFLEYAGNHLYQKDFRVILSSETPFAPYQLLLPHNAVLPQMGRGIANARRSALRYFRSSDYDLLFLADFDRLLFWLGNFPGELEAILASYKEPDPYAIPFTFIGRTESAMMSHPQPQRSTELAINAYVYMELLGHPAQDVLAGTYILTPRAASYLYENSYALEPGAVDVEWLALAYQYEDSTIANLRVDGLGYEGAWLGLEPDTNNPWLQHKRYQNLENAKAMVDTIKTWRNLI